MQNIIILKYFTLRNQKGIAVLAWSEEFSIKNQHLDEQHKSFIQLLIETKNFVKSTSPNKAQELESRMNAVIESAKEHFNDEEKYMQHIGYPFLNQHKTRHRELVSNLSMLLMDLEDIEHTAKEFYECLHNWLIAHILTEDKQIESYRNRLHDVKEIPYSLEQKTKILAETEDIAHQPWHKYICLCLLKEFKVCDALHKIMQEEGTFVRCKVCKQPLVYRDSNLDDEDNFEALAKKYFKQF
ncbi:hemerythrin domain-containing protein [Helicobacter sp. UBA3407]|uniref:bacteriohemerythrin n=1 Tax=Helicobacter TaxID=209 RepID=UPI00261190D0|nr:hemerythrin domain-containing protein [Helicobacter sp. UBA3407]